MGFLNLSISIALGPPETLPVNLGALVFAGGLVVAYVTLMFTIEEDICQDWSSERSSQTYV